MAELIREALDFASIFGAPYLLMIDPRKSHANQHFLCHEYHKEIRCAPEWSDLVVGETARRKVGKASSYIDPALDS